MNQLSTFLSLLILLVFSTCKKDDPLPGNTETGQNTFGCLINGKAYIPDGGGGWSGIKPVNGGFSAIFTSSVVKTGIYIRTYTSDKQYFNLFLNSYELGKHPLNYNTGVKPALLAPKDYAFYESITGEQYVTSIEHTGWINLTKADTTTGIVAGTFEFRAATPDGKTVNITQGRFDVNHRTQ